MDRNRRHVRHLITPRLYVAMNGSSAGGILYDVSPGGLSLDVVGPKPSGDRVLLNFEMPETGEHFEGSGRIIWQKESGGRVGIQFIDLPATSHLKIKSWISARSISAGSLHNTVVQDRADTTSMDSPESLVARAAAPVTSPVSSAVLERVSNKPASISTPAAATTFVSQPLATPRPELSSPAPPGFVDHGAQELRSLFSQPVLREPQPEFAEPLENNSPDWRQVRQWLLVAGVILFALMFLATSIKIFSSPEFTAATAYRVVKSMFANGVAKLMESPASREAAQSRVSSLNTHPAIESKAPLAAHDSRPVTTPTANNTDINKAGEAKVPAPDDRFEVTDALHGRRYLPRTSTNLIVQFQRPGGFKQVDDGPSGNSAPGQASAFPATNLLAPTSNLQLGRVLREASGERPMMEAMPDYPPIALQNNVQGRVVLTAVIGKDGALSDVRILSAPSLLDATVLGAVKTWRYQPHFRDGQPVEVVTEIVVDFSITTK